MASAAISGPREVRPAPALIGEVLAGLRAELEAPAALSTVRLPALSLLEIGVHDLGTAGAWSLEIDAIAPAGVASPRQPSPPRRKAAPRLRAAPAPQ